MQSTAPRKIPRDKDLKKLISQIMRHDKAKRDKHMKQNGIHQISLFYLVEKVIVDAAQLYMQKLTHTG